MRNASPPSSAWSSSNRLSAWPLRMASSPSSSMLMGRVMYAPSSQPPTMTRMIPISTAPKMGTSARPAVAADDLAARIDQRHQGGDVLVEERGVLHLAEEVLAAPGRRLPSRRKGRLGQRVERRLLARRRHPALRPQAVELEPRGRAVGVVARLLGELVLVARRGAQRRPHQQERQEPDERHDERVDCDDLDSHSWLPRSP